jgi:hypothetical protein
LTVVFTQYTFDISQRLFWWCERSFLRDRWLEFFPKIKSTMGDNFESIEHCISGCARRMPWHVAAALAG